MTQNVDRLLIDEILEFIELIDSRATTLAYADFESDRVLRDAAGMWLIQIGEGAARFSETFRQSYELIPWKQIIGLRHRLVHGYSGINYTVIWEIITSDIPVLKSQLLQARDDFAADT